VTPGALSVMLQVEPGDARALSIKQYGTQSNHRLASQNEWVSPPSSYEVVSSKPHPQIPGMQLVTVREVPAAPKFENPQRYQMQKPKSPGKPKVTVDPAQGLSGKSPVGRYGSRMASPLELAFIKEHRDHSGQMSGFTVYDRGSANTAKNLEGYQAVPPEIRQRLAERQAEIYLGTRAITGMDDLHTLANQQPSGYSKGQTFSKVAAVVHYRRTRTNDHPHAVMAVGGGSSTYGSGSANVTAHEAAHALDFSSNDLSQQDDFQKVYNQVRGKFMITPYYVQADTPGQGSREFFAEAFAAWSVNRADINQRAALIMKAIGASYGTNRKYIEGHPGIGVTKDTAQAELLALGQKLAAYFDETYARIQRGTK
jgi:hypothetical protein